MAGRCLSTGHRRFRISCRPAVLLLCGIGAGTIRGSLLSNDDPAAGAIACFTRQPCFFFEPFA